MPLILLRDRGRIRLGGLRTTAAEQVGDLLAAPLRHRLRRSLVAQRLDGGANHVVGVRRADRLGHHGGDAQALEHGAHRTAGDDAGALRRRAQRHATGTEMPVAVVMQRAAFLERNANHRLLGSGGRLGDRFRHFARLAMPEADPALAVADDDERGEPEALAALHRLRNAIDVDQLLDQLFAAAVAAGAAPTAIVPATAAVTAAAIAAAAARAATASAATRAALLRGTGVRRGRLLDRRVRRLVGFGSHSLELQSGFARGVGQRLDAAMVEEAATVEDDLLDAGLHRGFRHALADRGRGVDVGARGAAHVLFQGRGRSDGGAVRVVDHLGIDVLARTMHRQASPGAAPRAKRGAIAATPLFEQRKTLGHYFFFPSLRKIYSPSYLMPLPLYGSGLRQRRISAASWPTFCLSDPEISTVVLSGVATVRPSGTSMLTSWL